MRNKRTEAGVYLFEPYRCSDKAREARTNKLLNRCCWAGAFLGASFAGLLVWACTALMMAF